MLPAQHSASGALGCVPPQQAGRTTITRLQGQATSWDNLCTDRLECSPESLMQSSGSPMTQRNPPAFSSGINRLSLVHIAGGCSRYFCIQLPAQPFHTRSLWLQQGDRNVSGSSQLVQTIFLYPPWYPEYDIKLFLLSLVCHGGESWNQKCL